MDSVEEVKDIVLVLFDPLSYRNNHRSRLHVFRVGQRCTPAFENSRPRNSFFFCNIHPNTTCNPHTRMNPNHSNALYTNETNQYFSCSHRHQEGGDTIRVVEEFRESVHQEGFH